MSKEVYQKEFTFYIILGFTFRVSLYLISCDISLSFLALSLGCLVRKIQTKKVPNAPEENPEDPQENLDDPELEIPEEGPVVPNITK